MRDAAIRYTQERNIEVKEQAAEMRLRAEHKAGQPLTEMKRSGERASGGRGRIE